MYRTAAVVTVFSAIEHGLGFLYRMILSRVLGSEGLGVYQVALTVFAVFLTLTSSGLPITLSRTLTAHKTHGNARGERAATSAAITLTLSFALPLVLLLLLFRPAVSTLFSDARCADLFYILILALPFTSVYAILRGSFWGNKRFLPYSLIELIEEIIMIAAGILLLVVWDSTLPLVRLAAIAVIISYFCSFAISVVCFLWMGGRLSSPKGQIKPLLSASAPITAMRLSSSLVNFLISVLFPARLMASGESSARAMSAYGVVYGMVMPILMIPSTLIGSIALVLVPEFSACFYRKEKEKLSALTERALNAALLISAVLIPLYAVCGEDLGVLLYSNAQSGVLIAACAPILVPMSITMISTSLLNSMNCERQTLGCFLLGAGAMLLSVILLPPLLGSGALIVGMMCDYMITAVCSLVLLRKKTGRLRSKGYFLRTAAATAGVALAGFLLRKLYVLIFGFVPALVATALSVCLLELLVYALAALYRPKALLQGKKSPFRRRSAKLFGT